MIFIRILIKGYLKNITDNEMFEFEEKGIKNKNKIIFSSEGVKTSIKIDRDRILMIRDGNDFVNSFVFNVKNSSCNYLLKENNYDVDINIATISMDIGENNIYIKYVVVDSNCEYEYKIEMSDI